MHGHSNIKFTASGRPILLRKIKCMLSTRDKICKEDIKVSRHSEVDIIYVT